MKKQLRPYQENAISSIVNGFTNKYKQLCVLPTGSGKTVIFSNVIKKLQTKTLIVAHTTEILDQIINTLQHECPELSCQRYNSTKKMNSDIVVCSIQSCTRKKSFDRIDNYNFDLLIVDECHRSCAKGYRKVIDGLGFHNKKLLGVTATPFRTDKQDIYEIFGFPSFKISLIEMIKEGFLVDFKGYRVKTGVSINGIRKAQGDFISSKLSPIINVKKRNELIVNEYIKLSKDKKALAFCVSVKHAIELKEEFLKSGIRCEALYGEMSPILRKKNLKSFKDGDIDVLTNCQILTEGFDEPSIETLLMCRPTMSKALYTQMIGRGSRIYPGKKICNVIEFTDNDFDVCCLESLIEKQQIQIPMREYESFSNYADRVEKELLDHEGETVVLPYEVIIKNSYSYRLASPWQIQELKIRNIKFSLNISEMLANSLLSKG